jgi:hypothetical protein
MKSSGVKLPTANPRTTRWNTVGPFTKAIAQAAM